MLKPTKNYVDIVISTLKTTKTYVDNVITNVQNDQKLRRNRNYQCSKRHIIMSTL
jgi:hypothetical protein